MKATRLIYALIAIGAVLSLTGCISSTGREYYQLYLTPTSPEENAVSPKLDKILMVESVEVAGIYNDYRMVYRTSPYQVNYYSYKYWIRKPELLIRDVIADYLAKTNLFKQVIIKFAQGEPDWQLKASVYILEEYDRGKVWFAHLKMDVEVVDFKSGRQVLFHTFDRQVQLQQRKVEHFPMAISRMLKEELDIVTGKLAKI